MKSGTRGNPMERGDCYLVALVKGNERYVFFYEDRMRGEALQVLARFAADPALSFTWYDAAVLSQKMRGQEEAAGNRN